MSEALVVILPTYELCQHTWSEPIRVTFKSLGERVVKPCPHPGHFSRLYVSHVQALEVSYPDESELFITADNGQGNGASFDDDWGLHGMTVPDNKGWRAEGAEDKANW
ncbi:hypothetical protein BDW69DRAFT_184930 [Aspergillus filifer]